LTHGSSGHSYTTSAWVNCYNLGSDWANIWHLSENDADTPRNPAIWLNMGGKYIHACFTNSDRSNTNVWLNSDTTIEWGEWFHLT
jgi:hypothetical protein